MKKVFLTLMMFLFAFTGVMRADELTVNDGTTTNGYVPFYGFYADAYLKCEMVYPAADLAGMAGGTINGITFYASNSSVSWGTTVQIFMKEVDDATISAYVGPDDATVVYEGTMSVSGNQAVVVFATPYVYNGGNLLIGVYNTTTGGYSSVSWYGVSTTGASVQGYNYSSLASVTPNQRDFLPKTTFSYQPGGGVALSVNPEPIDLGYRPNGAWMAPYKFNIENAGGPVQINALDVDGSYFTLNAELPAMVYMNNPLEVEVTTGTETPGPVSSDLIVLYQGDSKDHVTFTVNATAYDPIDGDVFENAIEATTMPYETNAPDATDIYKNYELPQDITAADVVYKVTLDEDALFSAGAAGTGSKVFLYEEDFQGQEGPGADNNYTYDGPTVNPGPVHLWFSYDYTGSNTWFGTSAGGGTIYGYKIPAATLQELGLGVCSLATVETAGRAGTYYDLVILKGGDTPTLDNLVYYQEFTDYTPMYFFDVNLDEPQALGDDENLWIMFYSDSPYAAYCGRYPVDALNSKIWYTTDLTNWYSNTSYTPVIYAQFLELPTGRQVTLNLADMSIRESKGATGEMVEANGAAQGISLAQNHMNAQTRGNRDVQTLLNEGFEGGSIPSGWTQEGNGTWHVGSGDYSTSTGSATGTYNALITHSANNNVTYFVTPEMDLSNATSATVSCNYINRSWAGDTDGFGIYYRVNGGAWNELFTTSTAHSTWTASGEIDLTGFADHYQIGFKHLDNYGYGVGLDDVVVTADISSGGGGGGGEFYYQFNAQYVPAGTYYVVMASEVANFDVKMKAEAVPAPEQAVIISPYTGQQNVNDPYLAEWILGDYTEEMQVLVGTQYPPTDVMIDWTDELVESVFLMGLEHNKNYFMQVNARNAAGTTYGEVIGFSTEIDPVTGFTVATADLYPGDAAVFTWNANDRSLIGYNLYQDGVLVNVDGPITETTYTVEDLAYNQNGYAFTIKAQYAAGESAASAPVYVYMTGYGTVNGFVFDQDGTTPVAGATVEFRGYDEYLAPQLISATTDDNGAYTCQVLAGEYTPYAVKEGFAEGSTDDLTVAYDATYDDINITIHEFYYPLGMITATEEENDVLVEWDWTPASLIVDFETGDFSQAEFTLPANYPWAITTTNPHEGTYCMKSTCEGQASGSSTIEATVEVPFDAVMGFWVRVSSETNYDKFHFYIDGVEQGSALSGQLAYTYKEYAVEQGTHTFKWEYAKDSSVNSNDDCVYVDDITMYMPAPPAPSGMTYNFDNSTMMGWTTIDANNDGYDWVLGSAIGGVYLVSGASLSGSGHDSSADMVCSGSYSNATSAAITPDNYLVSPSKIAAQNGAAISFWACAQDASYAAEHFGVAVSTGSNTNANDFVTVQEWTMTAKSINTTETVVRGSKAQGSWYQYTVDLSSYAGQEIWVAIRHFNCNDQFILNVDDITLGDGSEAVPTRSDRSLQSYNLYRRDIQDGEAIAVANLISEGISTDVYSYIDNDWTTLPYGMYQWGIQATYEGNAAPADRSRETATFGFEGGSLEGWTGIVVNTDGGEWIHSNNNLGGYDYTTLAHTGSGFAMCYSYVDYDGPYDTKAYMVSPQKYAVDANSTITFWADNANDSYPEDFSVCVSTAANPTGDSDFTVIWNGGAKGTDVAEKAAVRHQNNRYNNWRSHEISLAAYAGQEIWIAFLDENYDMYEIWIDDVTITYAGSAPTPPTPGPTGSGLSEIIWSNTIEKDMISTVTVNVSLNNGQAPVGVQVTFDGPESYSATVDETGTVVFEDFRKGNYIFDVTLDGYTLETGFVHEQLIDQDEMSFDVVLYETIDPVADLYVSPTGWAMWAGEFNIGGGSTPVNPNPQPGGGQWYYYDNGNNDNNIGANGAFYWAIMFPAGSYTGDFVTKVATYDAGNATYAFTGTATIYLGGTTAPATPVGTVNVATTGATAGFVEYEFAEPVAIDDSQNLWVVFYNATSSSYCASAFAETGAGNANSRWVSLDGSDWMDLAAAGLSGYGWMLRVYVAEGAKGEVHEITVPDNKPVNAGVLSMAPATNRAPMYYKVKLDGVYEGETSIPVFQHNVENLVEGTEHVTEVAAVYATGMSDWAAYPWIYTPCDNYGGLEDYNVEANGSDVTVSWTLGNNPNPNPPTPPTGGFEEGFESGMPEGWTVIDGNNDGYTWCLTSAIPTTWTYYASLTLDWYRTGSNAICSGSYINGVGAITPNEYLVTSQVTPTAGSTFSFWAAATDASYPADHFGVAVSTTGTAASDFAMVQEWTLTGKGGNAGGRASRDGNGAKLGTWYNYTVDLSSYAGQPIYIAIRHFNCSDQYIMCVDDIAFTASTKRVSNRNAWDLVKTFEATSGYQYGVASDGQYIYTSSWSASSSSMFYKYDLDGNFIEEFNISGCGQLRDMTYDGQYFYGGAASSTLYCIDMNTKTLVSSTNTSCSAIRYCAYDPVRDGFWVGNWSTNIMCISRTGATLVTGPAGQSFGGAAYYKDTDDVEHVYFFAQPSSNCLVYDYNIASNSIVGQIFDFSTNTPGCTGSSGGCFIGTYDGKTCFFGDAQQSPQLIGIYELDSEGPGPVPPTPTGDVLGVYVFRDGQLLTPTPVTTGSYVDLDVEPGDHEYCARVVYSDYAMSCPECASANLACQPVTNLTAEQINDPFGVKLEWEGNANSYKVYNGDELIQTVTETEYIVTGIGDGEYTFGVVAVYSACESEMVTVSIVYDGLGENQIVNAIYPNPTNSNVTIEAQGMNHITVSNALGQVVYDADVDADKIELNLGQYNAGLYMVRVSTVNGVSVKRVSVVK